jgi:MarR family transcriptional regulator, organic hydroperoxide resistance regulator
MDALSPSRIDLAPLEEMVGYNVHILDLLLYQAFYERFSDRAMTPAMFSALLAVRRNPGIRHGALADALLIQRPNMTTLINRLDRDGFLERRFAAGDRRSVELHLSAKGEKAVDRIQALMEAHDARETAALTDKERKTLLLLLRKLAGSLRRPA